MANWADQHLQAQKPAVTYREKPPPKSGAGGMIAVLILVVAGLGGGGYWAWSQGYFAGDPEPVEQVPVATPVVDPIPSLAGPEPTPVVVDALVEPIIPEQPIVAAVPTLSAAERDRIERGVAYLERQVDEHQAKAVTYSAQVTKATTAKLYPPDKPSMTYEQWLLRQIADARSAHTSTVQLDRALAEFRDKTAELGKRRQHELDVITSLKKRIQDERDKLP